MSRKNKFIIQLIASFLTIFLSVFLLLALFLAFGSNSMVTSIENFIDNSPIVLTLETIVDFVTKGKAKGEDILFVCLAIIWLIGSVVSGGLKNGLSVYFKVIVGCLPMLSIPIVGWVFYPLLLVFGFIIMLAIMPVFAFWNTIQNYVTTRYEVEIMGDLDYENEEDY